jgi:hypothetical protein
MNKTRDRLLLAGIPAAGKSYFSRWLADKQGYIHVDVDSPGSDSRVQCVLHRLNACISAITTQEAQAKLSALPQKVVLDWGFSPENIASVRRLKDAGVRLFWFDGDRAKARTEFIRRGTVPVECLDVQMPKIERKWKQIQALFYPNFIHVLAANGKRMPPEEIWKVINAGVA